MLLRPAMATTIWSERVPGSDVSIAEQEGGAIMVIGEPDRVRTPPELGSQELMVASIYHRKCPCGGHRAKTYTFQGSDLQVSDCPARGFLWWKPR